MKKSNRNYKYTEQLLQAVIMRHLKPRQNTIVPNVSWGMGLGHECDILMVTPAGICTEIEIKVTASDLRNDAKKPHKHISNDIHYLSFCVPDYLAELALDTIPENVGLFVCTQNKWLPEHRFEIIVKAVRKPTRRQQGKWSPEKIAQLERLGRLRAYALLIENIKLKHPVLF